MNQKLKMIKQLPVVFLVIAAISGLTSCEKYSWTPEKLNPQDSVHFATDIQPIFTANCITCHGALRSPDLRAGKAYKALTDGGFVNQPGATSILYSTMKSSDHSPRSSDLDKEKVLTWINQGAHDN